MAGRRAAGITAPTQHLPPAGDAVAAARVAESWCRRLSCRPSPAALRDTLLLQGAVNFRRRDLEHVAGKQDSGSSFVSDGAARKGGRVSVAHRHNRHKPMPAQAAAPLSGHCG
ncbi:hypothetical protein E2C01_055846 [Portunus trituberculatus]|uniref:Uncharacterized protein n=1 Tax=Portunus trituberculatus TaxID=210409 RepID=A0A5B7GNK0_PORTR|nr:hypothetical protein [Portunus trituberculatus]